MAVLAVDYTGAPGTLSDSLQYSDDPSFDTGGEDSQYHEVNTIQRIPTKTGREDEMHIDSDRPGSAGTAHSTQLAEDDEAVLASAAVTGKHEHDTDQTAGATLFSRSDMGMEASIASDFSFKPASKQHMDFTGTRRIPPVPASESHEALSYPEFDADAADPTKPFGSATQQQCQALSNDLWHRSARPSTLQMLGSTAASSRKRAKKSRDTGYLKQCSTAKTQPGEGPAYYTSPAEAVQENNIDADATHPEKVNQHYHEAVQEFPAAGEGCRPTTLVPEQQDDAAPVHASSPHYQRQEDLEIPMQQIANYQWSPNADLMAPSDEQHCPQPCMPPVQQPQSAHGLQPGTAGFVVSRAQDQATYAHEAGSAKKQSKASRKTSAPARFVSNTASNVDSDINDYMQILIYKIREQGQNALNQVSVERDIIQQELQKVFEEKQALQDDLSKALQENSDVLIKFDKQKTKWAVYEQRVTKFKTFVNGLGHDVDALKREANVTRRKGEELLQDRQECKAEREALLEKMNSCAERAAHLKNEALTACSETQRELQAAVLRANYLDHQLSEKVGLLAEERDRRAQLERRLLSGSDASEMVLRAMKTNSEALLDKLHIMHAALECKERSNEVSQLLGETLEAVRAISAHTTASTDNAALTNGMVEAMSDRFNELGDQTFVQPLKEQLDKILVSLRNVTEHQEDRIGQDAAHKEAMYGFQQKLKDASIRIAQAENDLKIARDREGKLEEDNQALQNKVAALQTKTTSAGDAQSQFDAARSELTGKIKALEAARSDSSSKTAEFEAAKRVNEELQAARQCLGIRIQELEQTSNLLRPEKEAIEEKIRSEVERVRAEAFQNSRNYRAQLEMESNNQLRKLTSDRNRFEKQISLLKSELASSKELVSELQQKVTKDNVLTELLQRERSLNKSHTKHIQRLQCSLEGLQQSKDVEKSLKAEVETLRADLESERLRSQDAMQQNVVLQKQAEEFQTNAGEAQKACEEIKTELATQRANTNNKMESLVKDLEAAQEATRRAEAGSDHFKKSCDSAIDKESAKSRRQIEDLQTRLAGAEAETSDQKSADEAFRIEVEKQWQLTTAEHNQRLGDLRTQIEEAEAARQEAVAQTKGSIEERRMLLEQIDALQHCAKLAEEKVKTHQELSSQRAETSSRLKVPSLSGGITPSGDITYTAPTKPRKKVDRNYNTTIDDAPPRVPNILRPDFRRIDSSKRQITIANAVFEDSRLEDSQALEACGGGAARTGSADFDMFSTDPGTMPNITEAEDSQHPTESLVETQTESLPSIAGVNQSLSVTQASRHALMSSSLSIPYPLRCARPVISEHVTSPGLRQPADTYMNEGHSKDGPDAEFSVYEDTPDIGTQASQSHSNSAQYLQESLSWSQEERAKYTFRKTVPHPNSASKLVRNDSHSSAGTELRAGGSRDLAPLRERRFETPEARGEATHPYQRSTARSSSPAYVQPSWSRPARTYSNTPGNPGHRRSSKTQTSPSQDPRLAGRNLLPGPKRKVEDHIGEGYEHDRKKRLGAAFKAPFEASRFSERSSNQQSIKDLPSFSAMPADANGRNSQSRLRTLGGSSSRAPGSKRPSKGDEVNARFSQELR